MADVAYRDKSVLIVEDSAAARNLLRGMMKDFGAVNIDISINGKEALDKIRQNSYDLVLCDYNLGEGTDGQQVLEELRHHQWLKLSACFVMVTAESSIEMVMGALEYEPDGYLTKPFTQNEIRKRLDRVLINKQHFTDVHQAVDGQRIDQAVAECDQVVVNYPNLQSRALRLKGDILLDHNRFEQAQYHYEQVLQKRDLPWAVLGLGKAKYKKKDYAGAKENFVSLLEREKKFVEGYDWLAKTQIKCDQQKQAQGTLQQAVSESPKAILRQMALAKVAAENGAWGVAEVAYRQAVQLGEDSCYKNPENYLGLAQALEAKVLAHGSKEARNALKEGQRVLKNLRKEYSGDDDIAMRSYNQESSILKQAKKAEKAADTVRKAVSHFDKLDGSRRKRLGIDSVMMLKSMGETNKAADLAAEIDISAATSEQQQQLQVLNQDKIHLQNEQKLDSLNNEAVKFYEQGEIELAYNRFVEASDMPNAGLSLLLNTIQVCLDICAKTKGDHTKVFNTCDQLFTRMEGFDKTDYRFQRFEKLKLKYRELRAT